MKPVIAPDKSRDFLLYALIAITEGIKTAINEWIRVFSIFVTVNGMDSESSEVHGVEMPPCLCNFFFFINYCPHVENSYILKIANRNVGPLMT